MKTVTLTILLTTSLAFAQQRSSFDQWDKNRDGKLAREELPQGAKRNFERADTDRNGSISRAEHQAFLGRQPRGEQPFTIKSDLPYAGTDNPRQRLDLYLPKKPRAEKPLPVIAFIHGGAWRKGDKRSASGRLAPLLSNGDYVGVAIGYRLSDEAQWPAQVHDCKAAIRWIRANAKTYNIDPERIGVWGTSAGGHLVAMLGVSGGIDGLEGEVGKHLSQSSRVRCVVNFFGPSELLTMNDHPSSIDHDAPGSPESQLIGGTLQKNKDRARSASPITHVSMDDAPIIHIHGTEDRLVPFPQSVEFNKKLVAAGVSSHLITVRGGGHGNFGRASVEVGQVVATYFAKQLRGEGGGVTADLELDAR